MGPHEVLGPRYFFFGGFFVLFSSGSFPLAERFFGSGLGIFYGVILDRWILVGNVLF